jgi:hypothetical protein
MNSDEVNWLLQTIEDPENAKRFVQAQYQRGRIPYHVMASLARDRNWTDWPAVEKPAALISMERITTRQKILAQTNTKVQWTLSHGVAYRHVVDRGKHVPQD